MKIDNNNSAETLHMVTLIPGETQHDKRRVFNQLTSLERWKFVGNVSNFEKEKNLIHELGTNSCH
jgi:hypothetical protein